MKKIVLLLLILACSSAKAVEIEWHHAFGTTVSSMCAYILHSVPDDDTVGCYRNEYRGFFKHRICVVTAPDDVSMREERATLAHEVKHCVVGRFHKAGENGDESDLWTYMPIVDVLISEGHANSDGVTNP